MRFFTKKRLQEYVNEQVYKKQLSLSEAMARNAASYAVHHYICWRTTDEWRRLIDEAEKRGDKYMSLAQLMVEAGIQNGKK